MAKQPKEISTQVVINAPVARVWQVLTNFEAYPQWNPFIKSITGESKQGESLVVRIEPPGGQGMTFKPKVLVWAPNREFRWKGKLLVKGLFDGEHIFELSTNPDGSTTLVQREMFTGILVPLFAKMLDTNTLAGFQQMNQALKVRAEGSM